MWFDRFMVALPLLVSVVLVAAPEAPSRWQRAVGLLQYLESDYGAALASGDPRELEEQKGFADEVRRQLSVPEGAAYASDVEVLVADIEGGKAAVLVADRCRSLSERITREQGVERAPRHVPSLERGKSLYDAQCATCHGLTGAADTEIAKAISPPPANFLDPERHLTLTPFKAFNTLTNGLLGTAMPSFSTFPESDRWALAFYVLTLGQPTCTTQPPTGASLDVLSSSTDPALVQRFGPDALGCLRRNLPHETPDSLVFADQKLSEALASFERGDHDGARQAVVDAYLGGLEPVEPRLRARNATLVRELEDGFTRARVAAQKGQSLGAEVESLRSLLARARTETSGSNFWTIFVAAMLILLREGFEAVIVVGALLAVLKKLEAREHVRVVHAGWIAALIFGAVAFLFGQAVFAGARREWLETVVSLLAVVLLLYAALWLNARAHLSQFMTELRGKATAALGAGSTAGLFFISFSSVGRETVETALFLQGLAVDSASGVRWGALTGLVVLGVLLVGIRRVGFRLPMQALFKTSTVLLVVMAVVLLGKGVHGLQELGVLPLAPVPFVTIDVLGLFPDAWSLGPQLLLAVAPLVWRWRARLTGGRRSAVSHP